MSSRVRRRSPDLPAGQPVSGQGTGGAAGRVHPNTVSGARDTYVPEDAGALTRRKMSAVPPVHSRVLAEGLTPLQERIMKVLLAATDMALPHFDDPNADEGNPQPPVRRS